MAKEKTNQKTIFEYKLQDGEELYYKMKDGVVEFFVENAKEWEDKVHALTSELSKLYAQRPFSSPLHKFLSRF